jgi:hypothetical protein
MPPHPRVIPPRSYPGRLQQALAALCPGSSPAIMASLGGAGAGGGPAGPAPAAAGAADAESLLQLSVAQGMWTLVRLSCALRSGGASPHPPSGGAAGAVATGAAGAHAPIAAAAAAAAAGVARAVGDASAFALAHLGGAPALDGGACFDEPLGEGVEVGGWGGAAGAGFDLEGGDPAEQSWPPLCSGHGAPSLEPLVEWLLLGGGPAPAGGSGGAGVGGAQGRAYVCTRQALPFRQLSTTSLASSSSYRYSPSHPPHGRTWPRLAVVGLPF